MDGQAPDGFSITRILPLSPETVWDAWHEPEARAEWFATHDTVIPPDGIQLGPHGEGALLFLNFEAHRARRVITFSTTGGLQPSVHWSNISPASAQTTDSLLGSRYFQGGYFGTQHG